MQTRRLMFKRFCCSSKMKPQRILIAFMERKSGLTGHVWLQDGRKFVVGQQAAITLLRVIRMAIGYRTNIGQVTEDHMDTKKMYSDNLTIDIDAGENVSTRPWVKPEFQKEPLKEALSGTPGNNRQPDGSESLS